MSLTEGCGRPNNGSPSGIGPTPCSTSSSDLGIDRIPPGNDPRASCGHINLSGQWLNTHHRSGWAYAVESLRSVHSDEGVHFEGFLEKKFAWGRDPGDRHNQFSPYRMPWIGVLHNPPGIPEWFNLNHHNPRDIFRSEGWKRSVVWCLGLFTLSDHLRNWLEGRVSVPVSSLLHPTEEVELRFSMERFLSNPHKRLVQIGWWLRRSQSLFRLHPATMRRAILSIGHDYMQNILEKELSLAGDAALADDIEIIHYLPPGQYDRLLSENVVFLDLYDSSANNTIVECIVRGTPIIVNPLPAVREYLGAAYPLYFRSLKEAQELADDVDRIQAASDYLNRLPWRNELTGRAFLQNFTSSRVFEQLLSRPPKISIVASVFSADQDIRPFLDDITRQSVFELCELLLSDMPASHRDPSMVEATIREFMVRFPNIRYKKLSTDPGLYDIWNSQIREARGRYVAMAPLDDRRAPECLENLLLALEMNPTVDVVSAGVFATRVPNERWERNSAYRTFCSGFNWQTREFSSLGSRVDYGLDDLFFRDESGAWRDSDCVPHCMPLWRRSLHDRFGFFEERKYGPLADWEFWIRCASGGARFRLLKTILGLYFENPRSHNRRVPSDTIKRCIMDEYRPLGQRGARFTDAQVAGPDSKEPVRQVSSNNGESTRVASGADRFLIFALARTGSSTLAKVLNLHPEIRCVSEPFNPQNTSTPYGTTVKDGATLSAALIELGRRYNGIKHVWHSSGWPFAHEGLNELLLTAGYRVVLLRRANALQRIVSSQISQQCGIYEMGHDERERMLTFEFVPLDEEWIGQQLARERQSAEHARRLLEAAGMPYFEVLHEDIYSSKLVPSVRIERINSVVSFLGKKTFGAEETARALAFLDPAFQKQNSEDVYWRIPGIQRIEQRFGSAEFGWLFEERGANAKVLLP